MVIEALIFDISFVKNPKKVVEAKAENHLRFQIDKYKIET